MTLALKLHKSAGVPVTAAVHRRLTLANGARDARDWATAAQAYGEALALAPELAHIWIQRGHALKELADHAGAETAYRRALALQPDAAEPHLHLGHLHKLRGEQAAAGRAYLRAAQAAPGHADALDELQNLAERDPSADPTGLLALLEARGGASASDAWDWTAGQVDDPAGSARDHHDATTPALIFDASDLISYFRNARLPTGIQRVQLETIASALRAGHRPVRVCAFAQHRDEWLEIPAAAFLTLHRLSLASGDRGAPDWIAAIARLRMLLLVAEPMEFPSGAFLINLGTSWWLQNYFLFVRQAKAARRIRYVPFVHDLIPIMAGEHCTRELVQDFISWVIGAFDHADFFLVNSEATKRDLLKAAEMLGRTLDPEAIAVIRLDADIRKAGVAPVPQTALSRWGLGRAPFVLFVSTIESRKNHLGAFEAWIELLRRHGPHKVPKLVCVGNRGWLNDAVYAQLDAHAGLSDKVVMLTGLSDAELERLYRSCLFTLYPSRYEGWGLPVTESLCHGKVPLISDASSLPEAGGPHAVTFESGCTPRLVEALERLIFDADFREKRERAIVESFQPRTWLAIADQMAQSAADWTRGAVQRDADIPQAQMGAYHPIVRNFETRIWRGMRSAEIYRAGPGWWSPDNWGCWTKAEGGRLEIAVPEGVGPLRLYVQVHAPPQKACGYRLTCSGAAEPREGALKAGAFRWLTLDVDPPADLVLRVGLEGDSVEDLADVTDGLDRRFVGVGLTGFFLCAADDLIARANFLEAVALGNIDDLAFNREKPEAR
ncbi:glycosyltransferase family 4 protein [Caulobacter soli]|uniref:glycosyltransferase family 4 protein n=1 Tax=Caulobacter soli TaxID=2708539 RepID=UPI0013EDE13F|nr:glycosyltransferase [Caulobacter soli]